MTDFQDTLSRILLEGDGTESGADVTAPVDAAAAEPVAAPAAKSRRSKPAAQVINPLEDTEEHGAAIQKYIQLHGEHLQKLKAEVQGKLGELNTILDSMKGYHYEARKAGNAQTFPAASSYAIPKKNKPTFIDPDEEDSELQALRGQYSQQQQRIAAEKQAAAPGTGGQQ